MGGSREGRPTTSPKGQPAPHSDRLIVEWPFKDDVKLRLQLRLTRGGRWAINLRTWWRPPDAADFLPTKKGVSCAIGTARELHLALGRALEEADKLAGGR